LAASVSGLDFQEKVAARLRLVFEEVGGVL
jgi:hypothetical protein